MIMMPVSLLFRFVVRLRNFLFDIGVLPQKELPGIVVSVGNIHAGGVGKTPFVIGICREMRNRGTHVAVLTRGYAHRLDGDATAVLVNGEFKLGFGFAGDEAMELSLALPDVPIVVGADRHATALKVRSMIAEFSNITHWVMDDGFQHRRLWRDLDIVLLPADRDLSEERSMPLGMLREQMSSLSRASVVVAVGGNGRPTPSFPAVVASKSFEKRIVALKQVAGVHISGSVVPQNTVAVCGLGRPEQFFSDLRNFGVNPAMTLAFADHHEFEASDFANLPKEMTYLITTRKDFLRSTELFRNLGRSVYVAELAMQGPFGEILAKLQ